MFCCLFALYIGPRFQKIFADFGGELPALTQLAFRQWFPLVLGVIPALMIALALVAKTSLGIRRGLIVAAMFLSLSASGLCLYGIYGPILAARELVRRLGPDYRQ
jgi:type II secretory pathway component PulF